jgi:threonine dehydratase
VELLRQRRGPLHAVFVAIGGGGLIAGIGTYLKRLRPEIKVIGVEPHDAASMYRSLKAGRRVPLAHVGLFADGVAVKQVGAETFRLCRDCVDEIILADTDEICAAVKDVYDDCRSILEPAGALAVAGLKKYAQRAGVRDQTLAAVTCGANMNFDRLRFIAERAELGEQREGIVAVTIPERPGSFRAFCRLIGRRNITEFNYRYAGEREAHVFVGVEVQTRSDIAELITRLRRAGLATLDLSGDEVAKLHVRHLVGGRAPQAKHETLYRFEFPERPGALMKFLDSMGAGWNITLFHYRNHGADYGRVLIGLQVPPSEKTAFRRFLKQLGYPYRDETDNPAYRLFLG